jgi:hypothetical protein
MMAVLLSHSQRVQREKNKMTYDGALAMPRNCVTMTEDEMTYVEGGYTVSRKGAVVSLRLNSTERHICSTMGYSG